LGVDVKACRRALLFFRHGRGLERVGERGGEVNEKSRARDGLERGESNVHVEEKGDAMDKRARAGVGPAVLGDGVVVVRVLVCSWSVGMRSGIECLSRGVVMW
jgi:hypothetical protein